MKKRQGDQQGVGGQEGPRQGSLFEQEGNQGQGQDQESQTGFEDPQDLQDLGPFDDEPQSRQQGSGEAGQKQQNAQDKPVGKQSG